MTIVLVFKLVWIAVPDVYVTGCTAISSGFHSWEVKEHTQVVTVV